MLGVSAPTPYDLRFRLLDIPVRVHPLFWLVMAILSGQDNNLPGILIFIGCAFVSILVHEYGHGLMSRAFGYRPYEVVLYAMGGYCQCELERQSPWEKVAVLLSGPGAGFALLGLVFVAGGLFFGITPADDLALICLPLGLGGPPPGEAFFQLNRTLRVVYLELIWINLMWGILNLFPIWPLDGGRLCEVLLGMVDRRKGTRWAHVVSLLTAGFLAVVFFRWEQLGMGIWFAYFAFLNYQMLQALHQSARYGAMEDDADWWKR
jgi:Zn-dependent protease